MSADIRQQSVHPPDRRGYHIPVLVVGGGEDYGTILEQLEEWRVSTSRAREGAGFIKRLAFESQQRFSREQAAADVRFAVTAYTEPELEKKLSQIQKMIRQQPEAAFSFPSVGLFYGRGTPLGRAAFLFPGQGAQYPGMGGPLAEAFPVAGQVWEELGGTRFNGNTIREIVFPDKIEDDESAQKAFLRLSGADWTNPCIAVVGEAVYTLFSKMDFRPDAVAAHSFGDISAFRSAGILSATDMLQTTRYRGELGVACPLATRGCILIVPETAETTSRILEDNRFDDVWIANYNTPRQTVLSGVKNSIYRAHQIFEAAGINSQPLPISAAPHCPLAVDVAKKFYEYLTDLNFRPARCDVYSFLFGRKVGNDPLLFRKLLKAHVEKPVRFHSQIERMYQDGIRIFIEIGPSGILTRLVGQILADRPHLALCTDHRKTDAVLVFLNSVADLAKEGLIRNLDVLAEGYEIPGYGVSPAAQNTMPAGNNGNQTEKRLKKLELEFARIEQERMPAPAG